MKEKEIQCKLKVFVKYVNEKIGTVKPTKSKLFGFSYFLKIQNKLLALGNILMQLVPYQVS